MNIHNNIGIPDCFGRIVLGIVLLAFTSLAFIGPKIPLAYLGYLGIIPLIAGISGYCPPYALLEINTFRKEKVVNQ